MYSGLTPQEKAARVSAENRAREAAERRALLARPVQYAREHERGEHEGITVVRCPLCPTLSQEPSRSDRCDCVVYVEGGVSYHASGCATYGAADS